MSIFDPNWNNSDSNAYINWWFTNRDADKEIQISWDFFNMGKAYYANAITSIALIIDSKNSCNIADKFIFPILFCFWHGTELLLKAGLFLLEKELGTGDPIPKQTHDINQLFSEFSAKLKKIGFTQKDLEYIRCILDDFKGQGALPTFMRYTVDKDQNEQFYVNSNNEEKNVCINIPQFTEKLFYVIKQLPVLIEFLGDPYFGDNFKKGELSKKNYNAYFKEHERLKHHFGLDNAEPFTGNLDFTNQMLQFAYAYLLN